jgi:hypothetical protein
VITGLVIADVTQGTGRFNLAQGMFGTVMGVGASLSPTQKEVEPAQGKQAPLRRCSGFPFEQRLNDTHRRSCPVSGQSRATPTEQVLLERVTAIISSFSSPLPYVTTAIDTSSRGQYTPPLQRYCR